MEAIVLWGIMAALLVLILICSCVCSSIECQADFDIDVVVVDVDDGIDIDVVLDLDDVIDVVVDIAEPNAKQSQCFKLGPAGARGAAIPRRGRGGS